jgi:hypothetical protein
VSKFTTLAPSDIARAVLSEIASAVHELESIRVAELTRLIRFTDTSARSNALDAA